MISEAGQLNSLDAWNAFFDGPEKFLAFDGIDAQLQIFGEADASWLMISRYTSDTTAIDFTFLPLQEEDWPQARKIFFDFLQNHHYNFLQLLSWLERAEFNDGQISNQPALGRQNIRRNDASVVDTDTHERYVNQALVFEEYDDAKN